MLSFPWPSVSSGDGKKIPVDQVHVNERAQPLNQKLLDELSDSIARDGLQVPIVVRSCVGAGYDLVSGYHRLLAYMSLWERHEGDSKISYNLIPAIVMSNEMTDDEVALWELVENVKRRQMTTKERAALASRIQELRLKVWPISPDRTNSTNGPDQTNSQGSKRGPKADPWFSEWYKSTDIPKQRANDLWNRFKTETSQTDVTPGSEAGAALQGQFRAWCMAEQGKEREAAEKRKQADADDAAKKARTKRRDAALNAISTMVEIDGEAEFWLLVRQIFTDSDVRVLPKEVRMTSLSSSNATTPQLAPRASSVRRSVASLSASPPTRPSA